MKLYTVIEYCNTTAHSYYGEITAIIVASSIKLNLICLIKFRILLNLLLHADADKKKAIKIALISIVLQYSIAVISHNLAQKLKINL